VHIVLSPENLIFVCETKTIVILVALHEKFIFRNNGKVFGASRVVFLEKKKKKRKEKIFRAFFF